MSKYDRFRNSSCHGGYSAGPTVAQSDKLNTLLPEFKQWFASIDGFGEYLRNYFRHYQNYFDEYSEEHALIYTQLHKEFSVSLEQSIDQWLLAKGLTEDDFGDMLQQAQARGDEKSDEIVGVLLGMLDYRLWHAHIFALKRSLSSGLLQGSAHDAAATAAATAAAPAAAPAQVAHAAEPQLLSVAVPNGVAAGQEVEVTSPDGQRLRVSVPQGLGPGQLFNVFYMPLAVA